MSIGKIIRFVIIVGCIIGAYAYMASVSNKREQNRLMSELRSNEATRRTQEYFKREKEKKEQEEKYEQELKANANNAEYQVNRWYETYGRFKEKSTLTSRMSRVQISQLKKDMREAKEELLYWINMRADELAEKRDEAETEGNTTEVDYYNNELEKLNRKADIIDEDEDDE